MRWSACMAEHAATRRFVRGGSAHSMLAIYALTGFCVGALVGMTGVGGGSLMTPLLILLFGIHPVAAVGTDLLYAAVTKSVGTLVHGYTHTVDWRVVRRLAAGSVPAAMLTLIVLSLFRPQQPWRRALDLSRPRRCPVGYCLSAGLSSITARLFWHSLS